jgi:methionine-S-sulfoxide reductase
MAKQEIAIFAAGCFWCVQKAFDALEGVISTQVGYTGGDKPNPTYEEVCGGKTGHVEAIQVIFDPEKVVYERLLEVYWQNIQPERVEGQFCDIGPQYRPLIFVNNEKQRRAAEKSKQELQKSQKVLVDILPAKTFYAAEEYHQSYYQKSPLHYSMYAMNSGRKK